MGARSEWFRSVQTPRGTRTMLHINHDIWQGDFDSLPAQSRTAIILGGISHKGYNEVAAKVSAFRKTDEGATASDEQVAAKTSEFRAAFIVALESGTLGSGHGGGPRKPLEAAIDEIVEREVRTVLKAVGVTPLPKARKDEVKFANGSTRSYGDLLDAYLDGVDKQGLFGPKGEANKPRVTREAERAVAATKKKNESVAKAKPTAQSAEDLF